MILHYDPKKYFLPIRNNKGLKMSMFGGMPVKYVYKNKLVFSITESGELISTIIPVKKEISKDVILD